jgi:DNA-binding ferritin-like protein (Dps family)
MLTIFDLIENKTETWIKEQREDNQSAIGNIIKYIEKQGKLREPQLKSIETYLWLKFVGQNKELSDIIRSGLLFNPNKVAEYQYNQVFGDNYTLQFLNAFAQDNELKNLQKELLNDPKGLIHNWNEVLNELLHDFEYPNYLFSLPMGAVKTYKTQNEFASDKQKGTIEKALMIETKGKPYYTPEFQQKEQFVKTTFKKYNPNFEYLCFVDEGGNDFSKHLAELKKIIKAF